MANLQDTDVLPVGRGAATYKATFKDVKDSLPAVADASDTVKGVVELATAAETTTGTDATRAVTPAGLKVELDKKIADAPDGVATGNKNYVRQVATVSGGSGGFASSKSWTELSDASETAKGVVELATAAETTAGTDKTRAVHPAGLKIELDKKVKKSGDTMTGNLTVPSINAGPLAGFRNRIINGDLRVWQRGTDVPLAATVATYGADRWKANMGTRNFRRSDKATSDGNAPAGFAYSGLILANPHHNNIIAQAIELDGPNAPGQYVIGSVWTFSIWIRGATAPQVRCRFRDGNTSSTGSNKALDSKLPALVVIEGPDTNGWNRYAATLTIDGAPGTSGNPDVCIDVQIDTQTAGVVRFTGVQFEPGPVATPFEDRPIGTELALCQRYYQVRNSSTIKAADLRPTMRATPTVSGNTYNADL